MNDFVIFILILLGTGVFILYIWSIIWAYGDAEARGKPGILVALMIAILSWPGSLLLWIIFRPEKK